MIKNKIFIIPLFLVISCSWIIDDWQQLDLNSFKISIPKNWKYKPLQGEDSFIGDFVGPSLNLSFDCSDMGYANSLIPTEQEYLKKNEWKRECYFCKPGVTYTADFNVKNERAAQMKKLGTTDSTRVHVEAYPDNQTKTNIHIPTSTQKSKFPKADYIADLTYKDSTIYVPIEIPIAIKIHHIQVDTTENYITKTIWPKNPGKGMTGVYIKSRSSSQNFKLTGYDLNKKDQNLALQSFKTIKLKHK